jgi:hypothetical protein
LAANRKRKRNIQKELSFWSKAIRQHSQGEELNLINQ